MLVLNEAQAGLFAILNDSGSPLGSLTVGRNAYEVADVTTVAGVPLIVGAPFAGADTVIENVGSDVVAMPSLTLITMPGWVP
ncbi:MAG: hypothetical protein ABW034_13120, partial [Steroidobacteraceae bacterium]